MTVGICENNGGAALTHYTVYRDNGALNSEFTAIQTLTDSFEFTATGLTAGLLYHFKTTASNWIGESDFSFEAAFYAAEVPAKPQGLLKGENSSRSQIELNWPVEEDSSIAVTGYILECDVEHFGRFDVIMDGSNQPDVRTFLFDQVTQGMLY